MRPTAAASSSTPGGGFDFDIEAVTRESAARWLLGEFAVGDRCRDCAALDFSRPEVLFLNILGNRQSYRAAVERVTHLVNCGATCAVAHACGPVMLARYERQGAVRCLTEQVVWRGVTLEARRLFIPPEAFAAWLAKIRLPAAGACGIFPP